MSLAVRKEKDHNRSSSWSFYNVIIEMQPRNQWPE